MTPEFWVTFFAALPALIAATASAIIGVINALKLREVHAQINGRMDQLLAVTASANKASGVKQELDRTKVVGDKIPSL